MFSIRTVEAYLNLAEADVELGQDAKACQALDDLRKYRVKEAQPVQLSGSELMTFVREERGANSSWRVIAGSTCVVTA